MADAAVAEWVVGDDERRSFDALALIQEFEIRSALPALQKRLDTLPAAGHGPVVDERTRLERIVAALG